MRSAVMAKGVLRGTLTEVRADGRSGIIDHIKDASTEGDRGTLMHSAPQTVNMSADVPL